MQDSLTKGSVCFLSLDMGFGGAEKVIATLSNELVRSGREVTIVTLFEQNDFKHALDPRIRLQTLAIKNFKMSFFSLSHFIYKNRFDNFIANIWPLTVFSFLIRIISPRANLIYVEHCILSEQYKDKNFFFRVMQNFSIRLFYRFAHHIVSVSNGVQDDLIGYGAPSNKMSVIYNPLMPSLANSQGTLNPKILSWMKDSPINLVAIGQLIKAKNFLNLIKSVDILVNHNKQKLRLVILGDGEERAALEESIKSHKLESSIFLPGWVDDPIPYLHLSDLLILSSDYEGFGLVILEALSVGVNVVSTNCKTGPSEILKDGELGFLCSVGDASALASSVNIALKNPLPKERLISRASDFLPEKITQQYEKILI
jgi:glycosyltransferase involved in cell wall biosynthesis